MSLTKPSHSKSIATQQDIDADRQHSAGTELDYSLSDKAIRCHRTVNLMSNSDRLSTGGRLNLSAIAVTAAVDAVHTGPLLETKFYFVYFVDEDGSPPDDLAPIVKQGKQDDNAS